MLGGVAQQCLKDNSLAIPGVHEIIPLGTTILIYLKNQVCGLKLPNFHNKAHHTKGYDTFPQSSVAKQQVGSTMGM